MPVLLHRLPDVHPGPLGPRARPEVAETRGVPRVVRDPVPAAERLFRRGRAVTERGQRLDQAARRRQAEEGQQSQNPGAVPGERLPRGGPRGLGARLVRLFPLVPVLLALPPRGAAVPLRPLGAARRPPPRQMSRSRRETGAEAGGRRRRVPGGRARARPNRHRPVSVGQARADGSGRGVGAGPGNMSLTLFTLVSHSPRPRWSLPPARPSAFPHPSRARPLSPQPVPLHPSDLRLRTPGLTVVPEGGLGPATRESPATFLRLPSPLIQRRGPRPRALGHPAAGARARREPAGTRGGGPGRWGVIEPTRPRP